MKLRSQAYDQGMRTSSTPNSKHSRMSTTRRKRFMCARESRLLPQRGDAFGDIAVVDVHAVHLGEALQRSRLVASHLLRDAQVVTQRQNGLLIEPRGLQRALVPQHSDTR